MLVREQVDEVEIPGTEGYFGVLPGHTPMLASLAVGEMWYRKGQEKTYLLARLRVCRSAARSRDDPGAARRARRGHRREPRGGSASAAPRRGSPSANQDIDYERARVALVKSLARLQVASRSQFAGRVGRQRMPPAAGLMQLSWAVRTDPGLRRSSNEDSYCTRPDLGLFIVADGMGGHVAGEVASRLAVETIQTFIAETAGADKNRTWPFPFEPSISLEGNRLKAAFRLANRQIANAMADSADLRGMATTASAVLAGPKTRVRRARRRQPRLRAARTARSRRSPTITRGSKSRSGPGRCRRPRRGSIRGATS